MVTSHATTEVGTPHMESCENRRVSDLPFIRINASVNRGFGLKELWDYRELLYFLIWRDVKVRYKQTAIGATWAIIQPLLTMVIFTLVFDKFAKVPSNGLPYPIFSFAALLPWLYFSKGLTQSTLSLVNNGNLITKVYFPRLLLPISALFAGFVDFGISFVVLLGMLFWYGITPNGNALYLPAFILLMTLTALSVSLWLCVFNVRYRDVGQAVPFLIQIWMFASPVAYPASAVPDDWRLLYNLNPMAPVIEGFRWALLLGQRTLDVPVIGVSVAMVLALLISGIIFFKRMEETFADVV
jgi:lipopolysaccharide transport system permease protein